MGQAMFFLGTWVNAQIQTSVLRSSAIAGSVYVQSYLAPFIQNLSEAGELTLEDQHGLDRLFAETLLGDKVLAFKIWLPDGKVVYSNIDQVVGRSFTVSEVTRAANGETVAEFENFDGDEPRPGMGDQPLIEIYAPLYHEGTWEVVAVGEFYEPAGFLKQELDQSRIGTWVVMGTISLLTLLILLLIVHRGSSTIVKQRIALKAKVAEATAMAQQNVRLRQVADRARLNASHANEQLLAKIGAELHDGPVQLLTLLMLKYSEIAQPGLPESEQQGENREFTGITRSVLTELRNISAGLVLPELENETLEGTLRLAIVRHENLTDTSVSCAFSPLPADCSHALKTCLYRVVQEGLSNSHRHSNGARQHVEVSAADGMLTLAVWDEGSGLKPEYMPSEKRTKLGLLGMRYRVTALRGTFSTSMREGSGLRIEVLVPLSPSDE